MFSVLIIFIAVYAIYTTSHKQAKKTFQAERKMGSECLKAMTQNCTFLGEGFDSEFCKEQANCMVDAQSMDD